MLKRFDLTTAVFTIILIVLGVICYKYYELHSSLNELRELKQREINLLDEKLRRNESIIDSLKNDISLRESLIDSLSFSRQEIIIKKNIVIEEVKSLPLTEAVEFLRKNLKKYEEKTEIDSVSNGSFIF
jgi:hypothetical protein